MGFLGKDVAGDWATPPLRVEFRLQAQESQSIDPLFVSSHVQVSDQSRCDKVNVERADR